MLIETLNRCSREWPKCTRCVKRREECVYGEGITVETKETAVVDPRVKQLEAKLGKFPVASLAYGTAAADPTMIHQ